MRGSTLTVIETLRPRLPRSADPTAPIWSGVRARAAVTSATSSPRRSASNAEKASTIERTLGSFNIPVTVREARVGPTVTQFSLVPGEGVLEILDEVIDMFDADGDAEQV